MSPRSPESLLARLCSRLQHSRFRSRFPLITACLLLPACGALGYCNTPSPLDLSAFDALYAQPLPQPPGGLRVFHLGHSLVSRNMPAMLQQLAPPGHGHESQRGWGTTLKQHWGPREGINGFDVENNHPRYRDAKTALGSGAYDVFVMTEMVELRDAVKYFASWDYVQRWANLARDANPNIRIYLYETWHGLDTKDGWLVRLDKDLPQRWEGELLQRAAAVKGKQPTIYLIPAGQVFARIVREIDARGGIDTIKRREDLFARNADGTQDNIHPNDIGSYIVALTHYAVLYQRSPVGLPYQLRRANGELADAPSPDAARRMQEIVWDVVTSIPQTGTPQVGTTKK